MSENQNAPEIQKLVDLYGGKVGLAEKMVGLSAGMFPKFRRGTETYTPAIKARVLAAIEAKEQNMDTLPFTHNPDPTVPDECPEEIAAIIKRKGSKSAAAKFFGSPEGAFYNVVKGKNPPPEGWLIKARAELGLPVLGSNVRHEEKQPEELQGPPFVHWDGKSKRTVMINQMRGQPPKPYKNVPGPVADLLAKYNGNKTHAMASMGSSPGAMDMILKGERDFTEKWQRKVHAALHGLKPPEPERSIMGEDFDKYTLGLAIVMFSGEAAFDRINEIADILNGRLVFRKNTKGGWLVIYRMPQVEDLAKFKRLALRDANEIVCP